MRLRLFDTYERRVRNFELLNPSNVALYTVSCSLLQWARTALFNVPLQMPQSPTAVHRLARLA